MKKGNLIVGVDAGTSKTTVIVGEVNTGHKPRNGSSSGGIQKAGGAYNDSPIEIIGVGSVPSTGIKKGVVVNIEKTAEAIRRAAEEAARMADIEIRAVYASISGDHIKNFSSHGVIAIKENEIGRREVEK
ncbi:MAG: hypothetical protein HY758_07175, partial [Nitrospirae bacterium]|nr:hypothetical protein [Nitrospirota bacterium]